jgi:hypothetical protein
LNFGAYRLLVLDGEGDRRFMVIEQRDVARFPDLPAEDEGSYVPSNLNNGLESPLHFTAPLRSSPLTNRACVESMHVGVVQIGA